MSSPYVINKLYNFNTYAVTVLGATFSKAKLVAIMDYFTASKEKNVDILQKQVLPFLPPGTPLDIINYTFYKFKTDAGPYIVLASYWIDNSSQSVCVSLNASFLINNIVDSDVPIIVEQLRLLGYTPITATTYT